MEKPPQLPLHPTTGTEMYLYGIYYRLGQVLERLPVPSTPEEDAAATTKALREPRPEAFSDPGGQIVPGPRAESQPVELREPAPAPVPTKRTTKKTTPKE